MKTITTVGEAAAYFAKLAERDPSLPIYRGDGDGCYSKGITPEKSELCTATDGETYEVKTAPSSVEATAFVKAVVL